MSDHDPMDSDKQDPTKLSESWSDDSGLGVSGESTGGTDPFSDPFGEKKIGVNLQLRKGPKSALFACSSPICVGRVCSSILARLLAPCDL